MSQDSILVEDHTRADGDQKEFAFKTNVYITDYIKFADAKAGSMLAFVAAIGTLVAGTAKPLLAASRHASESVFVLGCAIGSFVFVGVLWTIWCALCAVHPRIDRATEAPLHSFPDLARLKAEDAIERMRAMSSDDIAQDVMRQNVTLARLAAQKFAWMGRATFGLRVAVLASGCWAVLYAVANLLGMEDCCAQ